MKVIFGIVIYLIINIAAYLLSKNLRFISNHDFNIGDKVRFKNGSGNTFIIESFDAETSSNEIMYTVNMKDSKVIGFIHITPKFVLTDMIKVE